MRASACEALTDFKTSSISEDSDVLCTDGIDNDGNGLGDCDDFSCLGVPACCTIPRVALEDDFDGACAEAACGDPDPACQPDADLWQSWGSPEPVLCEIAVGRKPDRKSRD